MYYHDYTGNGVLAAVRNTFSSGIFEDPVHDNSTTVYRMFCGGVTDDPLVQLVYMHLDTLIIGKIA